MLRDKSFILFDKDDPGHDLTPDQHALVLLLRHEFDYSYRQISLKYVKILVLITFL